MKKNLIFFLLSLIMLATIAYYYINNIFIPVKFKAMVIEQHMQEADEGACADLNIESVGSPTNSYTDPELGVSPTVVDPPAVIGGELQ